MIHLIHLKKGDFSMKLNFITNIAGGQDGAIFGKYLFRIENNGEVTVYDLEKIKPTSEEESAERIGFFNLDRCAELCPHSNSVMFGTEYFSPEDEFPLLYSNIYNNYAKTETPMKGVCCVYRIQRNDGGFASTLVQLIEIGFVNDPSLWRMSAEEESKRPYGNFTIDKDKGIYYAFVMRESAEGTRYFAFDLPKLSEGEPDERFGVKKVVLTPEDIKEYFDCEHHIFMQGACCHRAMIYSLEGFTNREGKPPVLRVIDTAAKKQVLYADLRDHGSPVEPEFIDFYGDVCYFADVRGKLFRIDF